MAKKGSLQVAPSLAVWRKHDTENEGAEKQSAEIANVICSDSPPVKRAIPFLYLMLGECYSNLQFV